MVRSNPLKKGDMGIAGILIVISQIVSSFLSSSRVSDHVSELKEELRQSQLFNETNFVKKDELSSLTFRLDKMNEHLIEMNHKIDTRDQMCSAAYKPDSQAASLACL